MKRDPENLRDAFEQALQLAPEERQAWLQCLRREQPEFTRDLEALLRAHDSADHWPTVNFSQQTMAALSEMDSEQWIGCRLGAYRLQRILGRGGMGMVFSACRDDQEYDQEVAVKVLPAALGDAAWADTSRRERQILADLQHPHISRLLDGGTDEQGRPYLVMELVDGLPITEYCERLRCSLEQRVTLVLQLCDALIHAHRCLVIHCDLKPGNVLVSKDGLVKLMDFGVARLLDQTHDQAAPLTPQYASPEQLRGEPATVASDIYSLGALICELLCGARPDQAESRAQPMMSQRPLSVDAARLRQLSGPRVLRQRLRGDLDQIVRRALQPAPERRYASVATLAADLRAWREHEPVSAHPGGYGYRAAKWFRRQPWLAVSLGGFVSAALGYLVLMHYNNRLLTAERQSALAERYQSVAAQQFLFDSLRVFAEDGGEDSSRVVDDILRRGAEMAESQLAADPALQGLVWQQIGRTQLELGEYAKAERWLRQALVRQQQMPPSLTQAQTLTELARLALLFDRPEQAYDYATESLTLRRQFNQPPHPGAVMNHQQLAYSAHLRGDYSAAVQHTEQALQLSRQVSYINIPSVVAILTDMSFWLMNQGKTEAALQLAAEGEALYARNQLPADMTYCELQQTIGVAERLRGDYAAAEQRFRSNLERRRQWYGDNHPVVARSLNNLALTLSFTQQYQAALPLYQEALEIRRRHYGAQHTLSIESMNNLAYLFYDQGQYQEAERYFRLALEAAPAAWGSAHANVAIFETNLAAVLLRLQRTDEACAHAANAMRQTRQTLGLEHWRWAVASSIRGACLYDLGKTGQGQALISNALIQLQTQLGDASSYTREAMERAARRNLALVDYSN
ncbi:MAG: hypothetical protein Tsb002_34380 [Wenzhouxiangellaceae bacterium]